jgi:hypothetical protein
MTVFTNFAKNSVLFGRLLSEKFLSEQFVEGASLVVTVHLGTSLPHLHHQVPKCPKVVHLGLDHVRLYPAFGSAA